MSDQIKDCPFCGEVARLIYSDRGEIYQVRCNNWTGDAGSRSCMGGGAYASTETEAIAAWNRRPSPEPVKGEISDEAVESALDEYFGHGAAHGGEGRSISEIQAAMKAALLAALPHLFPPVVAEVAQEEPVAWRWRWTDMMPNEQWCLAADDPRPNSTPTRMARFAEVQPLYTHPQAADAVVEENESLKRALRNLARAARTVFGALGPGQALQPAGAAHTNLLEATTNEADAVLSALVSHQGGGK